MAQQTQTNPLLKPSPVIQSRLSAGTGQASAKTGAPLLPTTDRFSSVPKGYKFAPAQPGFQQTGAVAPTTSARFASLPSHLGAGQYTVDSSQTGKLIKSERGSYDSMMNAFLRGGLSSRFYDVDHIMPLWAGGSDTVANRQILSNVEHDKKTKVGAVARRLYYSKEIGLREAQGILVNWKDKNVDGIAVNKQGDTSIATAQSKKKEWEAPPKLKWSNIIDAFKEGPKGVAGEFAHSLASGLSGRWIPPSEHEYKDRGEQMAVNTARFVGETAGTIGSFVLLGGLVRGAASALGLTRLVRASRVGKKLYDTRGVIRTRGITVPTQKVARVFETAGLFGLHGQLSKLEQNDFEGRTKRFLSDITMGTMVGTVGQTWKGYAGLGMGVYTLSMIEGAEEEDALMNAAVMVGLHGLGYPRYRKTNAQSKALLEKEATSVATDQLNRYAPLKDKGVTMPESKNVDKALGNRLKRTEDRITDLYIEGQLTIDQAGAEWAKSVTAAKHLYKQSLSKEARLKEEVLDFFSIGNKIKGDLPGISLAKQGIPRRMVEHVEKNPDLVELKVKTYENMPETSGLVPEGRMQLTGQAAEKNSQMAKNIKDVNKAIDEGKVRMGPNGNPRVLLLERSDPVMSWVMKRVNERLGPKVKKGEDQFYKNPDKNVQAFVYVEGRGYLPVAWWPREWRIDGNGNMKSINHNVRTMNEQYEKFNRAEFDITLNKNSLSDAMKREGITSLEVEIEPRIGQPYSEGDNARFNISSRAKESQEPYIIVNLTKDAFREALARNNKTTPVPQKSATKTIESVTTNDNLFSNAGPQYISKLTGAVEKIMGSAKTAERFQENINSELGEVIDIKTAASVMNGSTPVKVETVMKWLDSGLKKNTLTPKGKEYYMLTNMFYEGMTPNQKMVVNNTKLTKDIVPVKDVGQIDQKIVLEKKIPDVVKVVSKKPVQPPKGYKIGEDGKMVPIKELPLKYPKAVKAVKAVKTVTKKPAKEIVEKPGILDIIMGEQAVKKKDTDILLKKVNQINKKLSKSNKKQVENMQVERILNTLEQRRTSEIKQRTKYKNITQEDIYRDKTPEALKIKQKKLDSLVEHYKGEITKKEYDAYIKNGTIPKMLERKDIEGFTPMPVISDHKKVTDKRYNDFANELLTSGKTAKDPKVKHFWSEVVQKMNKFYGKGTPWYSPVAKLSGGKLWQYQADKYPNWHRMAGIDKTVDKAISNIEKHVRTKRYEKLPKELKKTIEDVIAKYPNVKIISSPSRKQYNPQKFYNAFDDIRTYIKKVPSDKYFELASDKKLSDSEVVDLAGRYGTEIKGLLGNIKSEQQMTEQTITNIMSSSLKPLEDIKELNNSQISLIAEDFARLIGSMIIRPKN